MYALRFSGSVALVITTHLDNLPASMLSKLGKKNIVKPSPPPDHLSHASNWR